MHIGLVGHKGAGKNLAAEIIRGRWREYAEVAFANPLKSVAKTIFGLTDEEMSCRDLKERPLDRYPFQSPRQILQTLGTEAIRGHWSEAWIEAWKKTVIGFYGDTITTDVRFSNEAEAVRSIGGHLIRIVRPPSGDEANFTPSITDKHASETVQDGIAVDKVVVNDGSMDLFAARVIVAVTELREGK